MVAISNEKPSPIKGRRHGRWAVSRSDTVPDTEAVREDELADRRWLNITIVAGAYGNLHSYFVP